MSFDEPDDLLLDLDPEPTVSPTKHKLNRVQQAAQFILANPHAFQASRESHDCHGKHSTSVSEPPKS